MAEEVVPKVRLKDDFVQGVSMKTLRPPNLFDRPGLIATAKCSHERIVMWGP